MADLTYLANADPSGTTDTFYALAKQYFVANGSSVVDAPAQGQTMEGILAISSQEKGCQATVNIVCLADRASARSAMPITLADQSAGRAIVSPATCGMHWPKNRSTLPVPPIIDDTTRVVIYGCDLGRSTNFLLLLSGLFGNPGELLAPRRLGVFKLDGSSVLYRQAQTWTLVKKAPLMPTGADAPAEGWPAYRTQFVSDASAKFGPAAVLAEADGDTQLAAILSTATSAATTAVAGDVLS